MDSFPKMQVKNRMAILKERISKDKEELKLEKEKLGKKKEVSKILISFLTFLINTDTSRIIFFF